MAITQLLNNLDPDLRSYLEKKEAEGRPPLETLPPVEARAAAAEAMKPVRGDPEPVAAVEDLVVKTKEGEITVRVYTPGADVSGPGVVFFHGGGWVLGNLDTHDVTCRAIANRAGAVLVSVDYRLAPEHKFPVAVNDCYAATVWTAANAVRLGIDPARISVIGDSAGGNLATVVALKSRDENGPALALQALIYPVTDLSSFDTASYREYSEGYFLTRRLMEFFRDHYLASPKEGRNHHASPLLSPDLRGLPPALIITAECDPLRDEGEAYAQRLVEADVPVTCTRYSGMIHPFFTMPAVTSRAIEAIEQTAHAIRGARSGNP